jgi:SAM-dependent methyltransferase
MESNESIFTKIYNQNEWGSQETKSGNSATLENTRAIRHQLPDLFRDLEVTSVLDCGCGDFNWQQHISFEGIEYLGIDIVKSLVEDNQKIYTQENIYFQQMDILQDPPETRDLWLARDLLCLYDFSSIRIFFQKFLESQSPFLAFTSVTLGSEEKNKDAATGSWRPLDFTQHPFELPEPMIDLEDQTQWFRRKVLLVYNHQQIVEWFTSTAELEKVKTAFDTVDRNAHLVGNVPLRQMTLNVHREGPAHFPLSFSPL